MPLRSPLPAIDLAPRLALFYAGMFVVIGIQLPFFPLWLGTKGFDAGMIGVILAIPMVARVLAVPLAARRADRREALRATIIASAAATAICYALVGLAPGPLTIVTAFTLAAAAFTPVMPLTETYALTALGTRRYGPVRLWGSAAFIVGTFGAGLALDVVAAQELIWLIVAAAAATALAALLLAPLEPVTPPAEGPRAASHRLLRDRVFLAVIAAASLIQASHAVYYGFSTLDWTAAGLDGKAIAALWALGVVAEIALFAASARLPGWLGPTELILVGAAGALLRWGAMALDPAAALLPLLQLLHALSFGATHLGTLAFVARRAPSGSAASAQGYLAIALGLIMAVSMGLSGQLFAAFGHLAYAAMALMAAAGGACALAAHRLGRERAL